MIKRRVWMQQPQVAAQIDWSNPICRGLDSTLVPPSYNVNAASPKYPWTDPYGWGQSWKPGINFDGRVLRNTVGTSYRIENATPCTGGNGYTTLIVVVPVAACNAMLLWNDLSNWYAASIGMVESSGQRFRVYYNGSGTLDDPDTYAYGNSYTVIASSGAGGNSLWVNGVEKNSNTTALANTGYARTVKLRSTSSTSTSTEVALVLRWGRVLSPAEKLQISDNPWQIFSAPSLKLPIYISSGGTTYTITPSGAISYINSAPYTKTKVVSPIGNISYSGTAALIYNAGSTIYTITPSGSITYNDSAGYSKTKVIPVSGLITYSGTARAQKIRCIIPQGDISYSGSAIRVRVSTIIVDGSIVYSGTAPLYMPGYGPPPTTKLPLTGTGI